MNGEPLIKATGLSPKTSTKGGSSYRVDQLGGVKILVLVNRDRRFQSEPSHLLFFVERLSGGARRGRTREQERRATVLRLGNQRHAAGPYTLRSGEASWMTWADRRPFDDEIPVLIDLAPCIGDIARRLPGEPSRELSTQAQLRFGSNGSVAVEIAGPNDHEQQLDDDPWELFTVKGGMANDAAIDWLRAEIGVGVLLGRTKVLLPNGLEIDGIGLFRRKDGARWAQMPSEAVRNPEGEPVKDERGKLRYRTAVGWTSRGLQERFSQAIFDWIEAAAGTPAAARAVARRPAQNVRKSAQKGLKRSAPL